MLLIFQRSVVQSRVIPWLASGIWALAAADLAFWVLIWPSRHTDVALAPTSADQTEPPTSTHAAQALGQTTTTTDRQSSLNEDQFKLWGIIASPTGLGSALISAQDQAPKAYQAGQAVRDGWVLDSVTARQAKLKSANAHITLDLPSLDKPGGFKSEVQP